MRIMAIGAMTVLLLAAAACGRDDTRRAAEDDAPPVPAPAVTTDRLESPTLVAVKRRGRLNCGVHQGLVGFAHTDNRGQWRG
ncbi:hypothetical protein Q6279_29040, partial [Klebsiella variicola]|nr:hypothetical protein [Klebsiella variicola]